MTDRHDVLHTRRRILGLAVGLLAGGCAAATSQQQRTAGGVKFPSPSPWCWRPNTAGELDRLGKIIVRDRNPYCRFTAQTGSIPCDATNTATWPQALTDEMTWKILTEFDFQPDAVHQPWPFTASAADNAPVTRSMRIPYLIKQGKAKKRNVDVGRENLLVGYVYGGDPRPQAQPWGNPDNCNDSIGELGRFITDNMQRDGDTESLWVPNWYVEQLGSLEQGVPNAIWYFRRAPIVIDYSFRFPIATRQGVGTPASGWIYVGYEGGGSY